jgi:hypothetical protein
MKVVAQASACVLLGHRSPICILASPWRCRTTHRCAAQTKVRAQRAPTVLLNTRFFVRREEFEGQAILRNATLCSKQIHVQAKACATPGAQSGNPACPTLRRRRAVPQDIA